MRAAMQDPTPTLPPLPDEVRAQAEVIAPAIDPPAVAPARQRRAPLRAEGSPGSTDQ
jgi:hypothetical protein